MTLPLASQIDSSALDSGADNPGDARTALVAYAEALKQLLNAINQQDGLAVKDQNNNIPDADLFDTDATLELHTAAGVRTLRHTADRVGPADVGSATNARFITRILRDQAGHVLEVHDAPVQQISAALFTAWSGAVAPNTEAWTVAGYSALLALPATAICSGLEQRNDAGGHGNVNLRARYFQYVSS